MRPAFSVVFLTTLIGAGQGLFLALVFSGAPRVFVVAGCAASVVLCGLGLLASFFHLGRPERAWRSAAMWRTSWLSREVIALPAFMAATMAYGYAKHVDSALAMPIGIAGAILCVALFYCTAMIYACVKFLQEWASPYTFPNFLLMGTASGFTLAAALAARFAPSLLLLFAIASIAFTAIAYFTRLASLERNAGIRHKSSLQSAIGVRHPRVRQIAQGFTGESFNTLEFFHGVAPATMAKVPYAFLGLGFMAPMLIVAIGFAAGSFAILAFAFVLQYAGLVIERWYFLADANHPQNLYYQSKA